MALIGTLYIVATPIGNLEDLSHRAARALAEAGLIACEDTRQTRKLLDHLGLHRPMVSLHEHNEQPRTEELIARLREGVSVALVSDAGTPAISDPGYRLVHGAIAAGIPVSAIPGPNAAVTALCASGLPTDSFYFGGFFAHKRGQRLQQLERVKDLPATLIFYETPHRIDGVECRIVGAHIEPGVGDKIRGVADTELLLFGFSASVARETTTAGVTWRTSGT